MLDALHRELAERWAELPDKPSTLYFGGGTPTVYSPQELQGPIERVKSLYAIQAFEEVTVEANPDDLTDDYLSRLQKTDVDRLSIGIQSFRDEDLELFNRRHTGQEAYDVVQRAKKYGFGNITVDLIYGIPGLTDEAWRTNLQKFLELDVPHLSAYHLTIEPRTVFGKWMEQGRITPVTEETSERQYEILERITREAGYEHYEISNFARPGFRAVHNNHYWNGTPYLGIGPAAHSFDGKTRRWNTANNKIYLETSGTDVGFETETLTDTDRFNETLLAGLRTSDGVSWRAIRERFGPEREAYLRKAIVSFIASGAVEDDGKTFRIPSSCFLISDAVIASLFLA